MPLFPSGPGRPKVNNVKIHRFQSKMTILKGS